MDHILSPIHEAWKPIFKPTLNHLVRALEVIKSVPSDSITPPFDQVFSAFCIHPDDIKVIIIGQDPYPGTYINTDDAKPIPEACGLSFSTDSSKTPASLRNIFKCLNRLGYTTSSNNLRSWVYRGVLLLNASLTTILGTSKTHTTLWKSFVMALIKSLTASRGIDAPLNFLLWGNDAKSITSSITGDHHVIHTWTHPSPMIDNSLSIKKQFVSCTNFDMIKMNWSTDKPIKIYTDGSISTYAVYIPQMLRFSGKTQAHSYELSDAHTNITDSVPFQLIRPVMTTDIKPTIPRCEYLAMCYALHIAIQLKLPKIEIITDHINICTILDSNKSASTYSNKDLVIIIKTLHKQLIEGTSKIDIIHTRSHEKDPTSPHNKGNNVVDKIAEEAKNKNRLHHLTFSSTRIKIAI